MTCNCMETVLEKVHEKALKKAPDHVADTFKVSWKNNFMVLEQKSTMSVALPVDISYRQVRTNGELYRRLTKDRINVFMSYCPFCGKNLKETEPTAETDTDLDAQERIRELEEALADTNHVLALSLEGDLRQIEIDALRRALNKLVDGKTGEDA